MKRKQLCKGIALMLASSLLTCTGQLLWKLSSLRAPLVFFLAGTALYGCGALLMIVALRFGELSVLHPMLSAGYVLSILLGALVLGEPVTIPKLLGIGVILAGLVCISAPEGGRS